MTSSSRHVNDLGSRRTAAGGTERLLRTLAVLLACPAAIGCSSTSSGTDDMARPCVPVTASSATVTVAAAYGTLEGTLDVPAGCVGMPVAIILSGSGPQDRDGNVPHTAYQADVYKLLSVGLNQLGVAVLRFDDPGVANSAKAIPADVSTFTYDMEVDASGKWIPSLQADGRFGPIVLAGHSQGSLTAILLARRGGVAAIVSLEGAGRPLDQVLREQLAPRLTTAQLMTLDSVLAQLKAGTTVGPQSPPLDGIFAPETQAYLISLFRYDPAAELSATTAPTLVVQGGTDVQVSIADAQRLLASKSDTKLVEIDDMCHMLKQAAERDLATQTAQYTDASLPLHPALLPALGTFLAAVAPAR